MFTSVRMRTVSQRGGRLGSRTGRIREPSFLRLATSAWFGLGDGARRALHPHAAGGPVLPDSLS